MKMYFLSVLLLGAAAHADSSILYGTHCASAAGYYANIQAEETPDGKIHVLAAQGYAYDLSKNLGLNEKEAFTMLQVTFDTDQCKQDNERKEAITCVSKRAHVFARSDDKSEIKFAASVEFKVEPVRAEFIDSHRVTFVMKPEKLEKTARRTIDFGAREGIAHKGLGKCIFKLPHITDPDQQCYNECLSEGKAYSQCLQYCFGW
jgi:hypothetical protein